MIKQRAAVRWPVGKLPPKPWKVLRHNQIFADGFRPVDLVDAKGNTILQICRDGDDRGLATFFEKIVEFTND